MKPSEVHIDVSGARTRDSLHELLARELGFPDYYGRNWDAFWDCITDPEQSKMPKVLRVSGWSKLSERLPRDARLFRECLDELSREHPGCRVLWTAE